MLSQSFRHGISRAFSRYYVIKSDSVECSFSAEIMFQEIWNIRECLLRPLVRTRRSFIYS